MRLTNLRNLDLSWCDDLPSGFPGSLSGEMIAPLDSTAACGLSRLQTLDLSQCRNLTALSDHFAMLVGLTHLNLSGCESRMTLPHSFNRLKNLQLLDLGDCKKLLMLPPNFGDLSNLRLLFVTDCGVTSLPVGFSKLSSLGILSLSDTYIVDVGQLKLELGGGNISNAQSMYRDRIFWIGNDMIHWSDDDDSSSRAS